MPLNRRETSVGGRHCALVEAGGATVPVRDDLLTALDVFATFADPETPAGFKVPYAMALMFPEMDEHDPASIGLCASMLAGCCWDMFGLDLTGEHAGETGGEKVFDWDADEDAIRASFLAAYGMTVEEVAGKCSYRDAVAMLGLIPHETPMGQALYYRTAREPRATKYNQEQVARFRELKAHYALKDAPGDAYGAMNEQANSAFAALKGGARG